MIRAGLHGSVVRYVNIEEWNIGEACLKGVLTEEENVAFGIISNEEATSVGAEFRAGPTIAKAF